MVVVYCYANCKVSQENSHLCCLLAAINIFTTWILYGYSVKFCHMTVYVDVRLILIDWER
jgi:hypothetical protein